MATTTPELQNILSALDNLQTRVRELTEEGASGQGSAEALSPPAPPPGAGWNPGPAEGLDEGMVSLLKAGVAELTVLHKPKEFLEFFVRMARRTGLRLLLLKRWTTGLQVYLEEGLTLPAEARKKRPDGRAPIPTTRGDIFNAVAEEAAVYAGPVPARNFPLDLTLMLGRGSRDKQILILPLPSQNHWNTFLYLDADQSTAPAFAVAEVLANYALARMCLVSRGVRQRQGQVASILKTELARRDQEPASRDLSPEPDRQQGWSPQSPMIQPAGGSPADELQQDPALQYLNPPRPTATDHSGWEADPFRAEPPDLVPVNAAADTPLAAESSRINDGPLIPGAVNRRRRRADTAAELPEVPGWDHLARAGKKLTPEMVLSHSGELPALPKAACHIMAVIEDPKTTATRLEKALAMDQALTAKVLRIANSPFYGAVREIKTVSEAIVRLGFVAIRNWTLVTAARSVFLAPGAGMLYRKIWKQSVLSAMAGQLVAQAAGRHDPDSVFIGGLMQNIGQLVLARSHPEMFQEILMESTNTQKPYHQIERGMLGFDHGELGALLIREWNLSQDLEDAVLWHHRFEDQQARNAKVAAMIALGEELAWCSGAENTESADREGQTAAEAAEPVPLSAAARFLGFSQAKMEDLRRQASQLHIDPHFFN